MTFHIPSYIIISKNKYIYEEVLQIPFAGGTSLKKWNNKVKFIGLQNVALLPVNYFWGTSILKHQMVKLAEPGCRVYLFKGLVYVLILIGILSLPGCERHEAVKYQEKMILSVEWGAEAGKFGLAIPEEGEIIGPRTFTIDDEGNIHIFDSIKRNIKMFSGDGVFLGSIGKELPGYSFVLYKKHYYFLDGETIYQYSLSGVPLETYPIAPSLELHEGYGQWMRIADDGDLYVKSQGKSYRICDGIGVKNTPLPEEVQIKSERRGTPDSKGTNWFILTKESVKRFRLIMNNKRGKRVSEFPIETADTFGSIIFLDTADNGTIYLEVKRLDGDGFAHLEIRKYKANGKLIESVELPNDYYSQVYKKIVVDKKGVLYQLRTLQSGVKVVTWSK